MRNPIVTTSHSPAEQLVEKAQTIANELSARYIPREGRSLRKLSEKWNANDIVIVSANKLEWYNEEKKQALFFHPGMSIVRAKRLAQGERDSMLTAASFVPGDSVLDCTAGMCADAVLFSHAGGEASRVTALESEFPLYFIVSRGLREYEAELSEVTSAMRRVTLLHANYGQYLCSLPDRSEDIVYFDPMFRAPVQASTGISPLRGFANPAKLTEEIVQEARRVARKAVLLKERRDGGEFERLGFTLPLRTLSPITYGVIRID